MELKDFILNLHFVDKTVYPSTGDVTAQTGDFMLLIVCALCVISLCGLFFVYQKSKNLSGNHAQINKNGFLSIISNKVYFYAIASLLAVVGIFSAIGYVGNMAFAANNEVDPSDVIVEVDKNANEIKVSDATITNRATQSLFIKQSSVSVCDEVASIAGAENATFDIKGLGGTLFNGAADGKIFDVSTARDVLEAGESVTLKIDLSNLTVDKALELCGHNTYKVTLMSSLPVVERPKPKDLTYTGGEQNGVDEVWGVDIENPSATSAGDHTSKITLWPGYVWKDTETDESIEFTWTVKPFQLTPSFTKISEDPENPYQATYKNAEYPVSASLDVHEADKDKVQMEYKVFIKETFTEANVLKVGDYTLVITDVTLTGDAEQNYVKPSVTENAYAITKKQFTITADNKNKTYGETDPSFTATVEGLIGSDKELFSEDNYSFIRESETDENVGDYKITPYIKVVPERIEHNYEAKFNEGKLTINKKNAFLTCKNADKIYGDPNPDFEAEINGLAFEETFEKDTDYALTTKGVNVGEHEINAEVLDTAVTKNYKVTCTPGTLTIGKRNVAFSVTPQHIALEEIDTVDFKLVSEDMLPEDLAKMKKGVDYEIYYEPPENPEEGKTYTLTFKLLPTSALANNYNFSTDVQVSSFTIIAGELAITPNKADFEYSDNIELDATIKGDVRPGDELVKGVDYDIKVEGTPEEGYLSAGEHVSKIVVHETEKTKKYKIETNASTVTVKKTKAVLWIEANSMEYGFNKQEIQPEFNLETWGVADGDEFIEGEDYTYICNWKPAEGDYPLAGTYPIIITIKPEGPTSKNYDILPWDTTFEIKQKDVTITTNEASKTYGDSSEPTITPSLSGLLPKDEGQVITTIMRQPGNDAGIYVVYAYVFPNATTNNYNFIHEENPFIIYKRPASMSISAAQSKTYGDPDPAYKDIPVTYSGMIAEDQAKMAYAADYELVRQPKDSFTNEKGENEDAGVYDFLPQAKENGPVSKNYSFTCTGTDFTITKRSATLTLKDITGKTYGEKVERSDAEIDVTNLQFDDTFVLDRDYIITLPTVESEYRNGYLIAGEHKMTVGLQSTSKLVKNYNITIQQNEAKISINKKQLNVKVHDNLKTYDGKATVDEYKWEVDTRL